jgi:phosphate transport system protein
MGHEARQMVVDAMRAFSDRSVELADAVIARDDQVDLLYHRGIEKLQQEMQADPGVVRAGTLLLFSLAVLERVGDRAQNIAWHTKEMVGAV